MSRTHQWFWALVAAQTLFLLGWAGYHEVVRQHAPVLLIKGRPVDPQDLLRGDYMILRYDISATPLLTGEMKKMSAGTELWVLLEKKDRYFEVAQVSFDRLEPKTGQFVVRGSLAYDWEIGRQELARIDYGIEKYFVPEGKGTPRFKLMEIEVTVSPAHRLNIRQVLLDGQAFP